MIYITNAIVAITILVLINFLYVKGYIQFERVSLDERKIHKKNVIRVGGIIFLSLIINFYYLSNQDLITLLLFSYLFLLIGTIEDIYMELSKYHRLIIIVLLLIFYVFQYSIRIDDFENDILNYLLKDNFLLSQLFCFFGLLILVNGFNFIDGLNGLLLGNTIIILCFFIFAAENTHSDLSKFINLTLISVGILLFINFIFGKILAGDGGSYFLGFLIGGLSIILANLGILRPIEIACIIYYPVMELIFTFLRRIFINKKNPFKPDDQHLHTICYYIINKKLSKNNSIISNNSIASLIMNAYIFITVLIAYNLIQVFDPLIVYLSLNLQYFIVNVYIYKYLRLDSNSITSSN